MCRVSKCMTTTIFVDFNKAFDSIDRRAISIVSYGISELLIANIMQFYIGTFAVVATAHKDTEKFPNGSCLFAAGLSADIVGSQTFQTFSTRQTPHLGELTPTTENFSTTSGVLQGDTLAPFLFITLLDYVLRETLLNNIDGLTFTPHRS